MSLGREGGLVLNYMLAVDYDLWQEDEAVYEGFMSMRGLMLNFFHLTVATFALDSAAGRRLGRSTFKSFNFLLIPSMNSQ